MNNPFDDYLLLLEQMRVELSHLSELANAKISAVQKNDLIALDKVMKQEQASSMTFRGLEQKQTLLLRATELTDVPLSSLPEKYPPEKRLDAKNTVEKLQNQYQIYRCSSEVARNTLECNLHVIDKIISDSDQSSEGPGYQEKTPQLPSAMKTDFRA